MNNAQDIEESVIGVLMIDSTAIMRCTIEPHHCFSEENKTILKAIFEL